MAAPEKKLLCILKIIRNCKVTSPIPGISPANPRAGHTKDSAGICIWVDCLNRLDDIEVHRVFNKISATWPDSSGSPIFPVPSPTGSPPASQYRSAISFWQGDYGARREALLNYAIEVLEGLLEKRNPPLTYPRIPWVRAPIGTTHYIVRSDGSYYWERLNFSGERTVFDYEQGTWIPYTPPQAGAYKRYARLLRRTL
jgi:hypothetical protein